jgi:PBSX family phage terminase large subunit
MPEIRLSNWQTQVWLDETRYKVVNIGRRGGKSTLAAVKMADHAAKHEKSIIWYVAPNYKQAKSIMWEMLKEVIPADWIKKTNETELKMFLVNGTQILLKGAEDPDTLRGVRIDLAVFDEVAFMTKWDDVWKVMRPTLVDSQAEAWFISTPNGFNHFKDLAEKTDPDYKYFHYTSYDNPYLSKEEIDKMRGEMDEDSFAQEILGEFRKMSGLIYKQFNRDIHMVDIPELDESWTRTRAIDFGFAHKTAVGWFAINTTGTEIYMYDGIYDTGLTMDDVAAAVKIKDGSRMMTSPVGDSAQPILLKELDERGVHFAPVKKGPDSVKNGIAQVAELLRIRADTGKPTLMFSKSLTWVADEAEKYRWLENKVDGYIKETPMKRDDDAMDMIRYFAISYKQPYDDDLGYDQDEELFSGGFY